MLFYQGNILLEVSRAIHNNILNMTELEKYFKVAKIVESGIKENEERESLHFLRVLFITKADDIFTLEFRSKTADMKLLHSVVMHNMKKDNIITVYADGDKPMDKFIDLVKNGSPTRFNGIFSAMEAAAPTSSNNFALLAALLAPIILLVSYGLWLGRRYKMTMDENDAIKAEGELDKFLFKGQTKEEPAFNVYSDITQHIDSVVSGNKRSLILYGKPGTSKTYLVRRSLHFSKLNHDVDYTFMKGSAGDPKKAITLIYETLWRYKNKLIVFDDFDTVLDNPEVINILKAAMDSYPVRIISLPSSGGFEDQKLPRRFNFEGSIIIITNKKEIDSALLSRATAIRMDFTSEEFKDHIGKLLKFISPQVDNEIKEEVFEYMCKQKNIEIDFRKFGSMVDLRVANPDNWKQLSTEILHHK